MSDQANRYDVVARVKEFAIPPIQDGLVVGRDSPIGSAALRKALEVLNGTSYEFIPVKDDVVSEIIVREQVTRRLPREQLTSFVLDRVKSLMTAREILHLDLSVQVTVEAALS